MGTAGTAKGEKSLIIISALNIPTYMPHQADYTQIKLLPEELFYLGVHCLPISQHFLVTSLCLLINSFRLTTDIGAQSNRQSVW